MQLQTPKIAFEIVEELLEKYVGGVKFFDNLDASWRTPRGQAAVEELVTYALSQHRGCGFIGSGRFGMYLHNAFEGRFTGRLLLVTGGLRTTAPMDDLCYLEPLIRGRDFVFLDDSFYSGKTRDLIKAEIERQGGRLVHSVVIYDGSKNKDPETTAMFRYYDHYRPDNTKANPNVKVSPSNPPLEVPVAAPVVAKTLAEAARSFKDIPEVTAGALQNAYRGIEGFIHNYWERYGTVAVPDFKEIEIEVATVLSPKGRWDGHRLWLWFEMGASPGYVFVSGRTDAARDWLDQEWMKICYGER